jgi:type II secretion system protein D
MVAQAVEPEEEEEKGAEEEAPETPLPGTTPMQPMVAAAPTPTKNAAAAPPGSTPAATLPPSATANPPAGAPATVRLQFPNSDIVDVLHLYEQLTGNKLVMDNFVQGKVNIFITKDVSREEAIKIIEMSMALNGISLVPAAPGIIEVVGLGQNPRKAVVPIVSDLADIPSGNPVVSFVFHLRYADPQELQQVLTAYFQGSSGVINILALPKSGALLVTQNADIVRQIAAVIQQVDVAPAEVVSEFIKLERADATKVVEMLKDIFEKGGQPTGGVRSIGVPQPLPQPVTAEGVPGPQVGALTEEAVVVGKIKLTADVRTNRIHVVTRPINMPFIRKLVREFDANVEFAKPVTRPLKYISAGDVLPVLVQALTEPGAPSQPGAPGVGGSPPPQPTPSRTTPTAGTSTTAYTGGFPGTAGGTATAETLNISEELSTQPVDTSPKAVTVGNAKLIADQRANSIIILGSREVVVKIEKILDEMDVKAPQVALSTVIGELTLKDNETFGVDYFVRHSRGLDVAGTTNFTGVPPTARTVGGTNGRAAAGSIFDPGNLISFTQLATTAVSGVPGANVYLAAGKTLAAVVHALEETGRFRVVNRPTVFTSNNKKAIIASGTEVPVPVSTLTNVVAGTTTPTGQAAVTSNIEFKRIALQLEVVPLINSEKEVSLDILQKVDSIAGNTLLNGNLIPNVSTRYVRTNVSAPTGSTIVLGGLITDEKRKDISGIPILDKLPYVGALFRTTSTTNMRTELIVLMCPQVTLTKLDLYRLRQEKEDKTHFGPELDQGDCPDCPPRAGEGKQLPPPDLPPATK